MQDFTRYAVYYAPPAGSALAAFGNAWLGRDPESGAAIPRPALEELPAERIAAITRSPARYGFHGTLKPPFALADGADRPALEAAVEDLAAQLRPATAEGGLALHALGRFLALTPQGDGGAIQALAAEVVERLDPLRAPPDEGELTRRRRAGLSDRQEALLQRWGYPYVMEEFRFHLTLTDALEAAEQGAVAQALAPAVAPFAQGPFRLDALALFGDPGGGAPFQLLRRFALSR